MTQEIIWTSEELLAATGGELRGAKFEATGLSIDTRSLQAGQVFLALVGDNSDGHGYLSRAAEAGAVAAIVSEIPADAPQGLPLLLVHHTQMALEDIGRAARKRSAAKFIAITGSVGKTSAKEMLKLALQPYGEVYATSGNYNNHLGLPLTLANMPRDSEFAILEMGMNHAGEIDFLSRMGEPDVGLITTVEAVHLEFFDSVEEIARAKAELFVGMAEGHIAVLPADNPHFALMSERALSQSLYISAFGEAAGAEFRLISQQITREGAAVRYSHRGAERRFRLKSLGAHWPRLALAILAVVEALRLPLDKAEQALAQFSEQAGRGQVVNVPWKGGEITLIDDSYNASPVSMRGALEKLGMLEPTGAGRRIAVLGEMRELGAESAAFHAELAPIVQAQKVDKVYAVGRWMEHLVEALPESQRGAYTTEVKSLGEALFADLQAGDVVLLKGSHGSKVYQLVAALREGGGRG